MLTNLEIDDLAHRMHMNYAGCFSKDNFPERIEVGPAYFINLEDSRDENGQELPGSHWTCLMALSAPNGDPQIFYFDSFGIGCPQNIDTSIKKQFGRRTRISSSLKQIQHKDVSACCGWFCLAWAHFMQKRSDGRYFNSNYYDRYGDFLELFDAEDLEGNDMKLKMFFRPKTE